MNKPLHLGVLKLLPTHDKQKDLNNQNWKY